MNFEIPKLAWLKAVMLAAAKKDVRYYLNGVMVRNGEMAATNGHMLLLIKSDGIKSDGEYIIDNDTLKKIVTAHKGIKGDNRVEVADSMTATGNSKTHIAPLDGKFPDVDRVIPANTSGKVGQFDFDYLATLQKANQEFLVMRNALIYLQHNGPVSAAKFETETYGAVLVGVVMPYRTQP